MPRKLSKETDQQIIALGLEGKNLKEIANLCNISVAYAGKTLRYHTSIVQTRKVRAKPQDKREDKP